MPRLIHRAGTCDNGPCPNLFELDTDPGTVAIQGTTADPQLLGQLPGMPGYESLVLFPKALIIEYARKLMEAMPA
jgi:hypothetical protein